MRFSRACRLQASSKTGTRLLHRARRHLSGVFMSDLVNDAIQHTFRVPHASTAASPTPRSSEDSCGRNDFPLAALEQRLAALRFDSDDPASRGDALRSL